MTPEKPPEVPKISSDPSTDFIAPPRPKFSHTTGPESPRGDKEEVLRARRPSQKRPDT